MKEDKMNETEEQTGLSSLNVLSALSRAEERQGEITQAAEAFVVRDAESYRVAAQMRKGIAAMVDEIRAAFRPIIRAAHVAWQEALAREKSYLRPWADADERLRAKVAGYLVEERRKADAAEAERQAALREKARIQQEAIDKAVAADMAGKRAEANRILDLGAKRELEVKVPPPPPKPAPTEGTHLRTYWRFRITDPDLVPRNFCVPDERRIDAVVQLMKEKTSIPGVLAYADHVAVTKKG